MASHIRKRRDKLWKDNEGKCYWCGIQTVLPPRYNNRHKPTHDLATLDHLRTRFNSHRLEPNISNECRTVLSCHRCNHLRGALHYLLNSELIIKKKPIFR